MSLKFWISVGSNLQPEESILKCAALFVEAFGVGESSLFYWNPPIGRPEQPDYLNGIWAVELSMTPDDFKGRLRSLESLCGRIRNPQDKYASRTMDLDLIGIDRSIFDIHEVEERVFLRQALIDLNHELARSFEEIRPEEWNKLRCDHRFSKRVRSIIQEESL